MLPGITQNQDFIKTEQLRGKICKKIEENKRFSNTQAIISPSRYLLTQQNDGLGMYKHQKNMDSLSLVSPIATTSQKNNKNLASFMNSPQSSLRDNSQEGKIQLIEKKQSNLKKIESLNELNAKVLKVQGLQESDQSNIFEQSDINSGYLYKIKGNAPSSDISKKYAPLTNRDQLGTLRIKKKQAYSIGSNNAASNSLAANINFSNNNNTKLSYSTQDISHITNSIHYSQAQQQSQQPLYSFRDIRKNITESNPDISRINSRSVHSLGGVMKHNKQEQSLDSKEFSIRQGVDSIISNDRRNSTSHKVQFLSKQKTITLSSNSTQATLSREIDALSSNNNSNKGIEKLKSLVDQYDKCISEILGDTSKMALFDILNTTMELVEQGVNDYAFTIENYEMYSDIARDLGDYNKAIQLLKHMKLITSMISRYDLKSKIYRKLADIYSETAQYNKSLVYLKKMLRLSWKIRDDDAEIEIYDLIGKTLVQIGEVELSDFFHSKSMTNDREMINSPLRVAGEMGVKLKNSSDSTNLHDLHDYYSGSEDDMDLTSFKKSKSAAAQYQQMNQNQNHHSQFILPRVITNYGRKNQQLGRPEVPSYLRDEAQIKVCQRMSHMSQNRDLKNFYIYAFKNSQFWVKEGGDQLQKYLVLKKNSLKHKHKIQKLDRVVKQMISQMSYHNNNESIIQQSQVDGDNKNKKNSNNSSKTINQNYILSHNYI